MHLAVQLGLVCALSAAPLNARAQDALGSGEEPSWKFREYLAETFLRERIEGQREGVRLAAKGQVETIVAQLELNNTGLPESLFASLRDDGNAMVDDVIGRWTVDDALAKYVEAFERSYPDGEMDGVIALLTSPEGKKLAETMRDAMFAMTRYVNDRLELALQRKLLGFASQAGLRLMEARQEKR